jgi:hypothetical protein
MIGIQEDSPMKYDVISADGHVDLIWLPPDLFTKNASAAFKDRMPHVIDGPKGPNGSAPRAPSSAWSTAWARPAANTFPE